MRNYKPNAKEKINLLGVLNIVPLISAWIKTAIFLAIKNSLNNIFSKIA